MSNPKPICIGTHDGNFHADDVLAVAILTTLYPDHHIIRSRDDDILSMADIVVDVGDRYDHHARRYDHHMHNPTTDRSGHVFSSAGLIWRHYAKRYLNSIGIPRDYTFAGQTIDLIQEVEKNIRTHWIFPIDRADNGVPQGLTPISEVVNAMRPITPEQSHSRYNAQFLETVSMVSHLFKRACFHSADHIAAKWRCKLSKKQELADGQIVISSEPLHSYKMFSDTLAHFVICPSEEYKGPDPYYIVRLIVNPLTKEFKTKFPLPVLGTRYETIERELGVRHVSYVHHAGFLALTDSLDAALDLCNVLLDRSEITKAS